MAVFLVLGMFMDWIGILLLCMPIFVPIVIAPCYLKSVAPPEITLQSVFSALWPFIMLQLTVLALLVSFPEISRWLPKFFG